MAKLTKILIHGQIHRKIKENISNIILTISVVDKSLGIVTIEIEIDKNKKSKFINQVIIYVFHIYTSIFN